MTKHIWKNNQIKFLEIKGIIGIKKSKDVFNPKCTWRKKEFVTWTIDLKKN